ncbi:MAG: hypothetical protein KC615_04100 [Anaerolineae bacterium]|nr:hypothetical protein [Anaerolineae bacterium]MCA9892137.1 hypothetical protein [Anaerolineae bacterium]MCB9460000.1 hypothetical protein [Anaerolineaceae bacterium]
MAETPKRKNSSAMQDVFLRMGVLGELLSFLWKRKLYWLIPMMIVLFLFAVIIIIGSTGPGGAFIYTLF